MEVDGDGGARAYQPLPGNRIPHPYGSPVYDGCARAPLPSRINPNVASQRETALWLPLALMWVRFEVPTLRPGDRHGNSSRCHSRVVSHARSPTGRSGWGMGRAPPPPHPTSLHWLNLATTCRSAMKFSQDVGSSGGGVRARALPHSRVVPRRNFLTCQVESCTFPLTCRHMAAVRLTVLR